MFTPPDDTQLPPDNMLNLSDALPALKKERLAKQEFTILHKTTGKWAQDEISLLASAEASRGEIFRNRHHPDHLIVVGKLTEEEVSAVLKEAGTTFTLKVVVGIDNVELPYRPSMS